MSDQKVSIRFFVDLEREEAWLNRQSDRGYMLVKKRFLCYEFQKSDTKYRYHIDPCGYRKDWKSYVSFLEGCQMTLVSQSMGCCYFKSRSEDNVQELYTDCQSQRSYYWRRVWLLLLLLLLSLSVVARGRGPYLCNISISMTVNTIIAVLCCLNLFKCARKIGQLSKELYE